MQHYDRIIIGAGLYGLYSALFCAKQGMQVLVLEYENAPFKRATYINQARVHMGYHYPRSISTALKSKRYFDRFNKDFGFCINAEFDQIYATSANFSWTNAEQFRKFCDNASIRCEDISPTKYFNEGMCDGAFLTQEYTYDAYILRDYFVGELSKYPKVKINYNSVISSIRKQAHEYILGLSTGEEYQTNYILNATYASVNQIHNMVGFEPFKIKYELCEIILCNVNKELKDIGITVMDGPFFSIMPFGKTGLHSLTSVTFTPHTTSFHDLPIFDCQNHCGDFCNAQRLGNCDECPARPESSWSYMSNLARKYLKSKYEIEFVNALYSIKPILMASEIDDSRPTVIRQFSENPSFFSVLSGKINTVYDLDEVL
ncbi:MAG TPA: FAD-dependent oxidoreductase [Anaerolineaceae bacterium]|nr:FAD-dependent oxidoreductase [Anaerolineaceae bacterium]HPN52505.1 FAD-dependent oxidoreductase [Anaerolineaceae bacterium]